MKKVLIIGKNSYIGSQFIRHVQGDMLVEEVDSFDGKWKEADFSKFDAVLHLAGIAHVSRDPKMEGEYYKINRDLALEVATYAKEKGVKQFIFMSSMIIYGADGKVGKSKNIVTSEEYAPVDFYGKSKLEADLALQAMKTDTFKPVIVRTPMVYGENCKGNFPLLVKASKKIPLFPNIKNERSMIYVGNLAEFFKLVIENEAEGVFYPQNTEYVSTGKVVKDMATLQGRKLWSTGIFNPMLKLCSFIGFINKVFGNKTYDKSLSNAFNGEYNIYSYEESLKRTLELENIENK